MASHGAGTTASATSAGGIDMLTETLAKRNLSDGNVNPPMLQTEIRSSSLTLTTSTVSSSSGGLVRSSSWKKFKNTVKETVTGMVGMTVATPPTSPPVTDGHLCENLTPDMEHKLVSERMMKTEPRHNKLIHSAAVPIPSVNVNAIEDLERHADAAFAAAATLPSPPQFVPQIVVTSDGNTPKPTPKFDHQLSSSTPDIAKLSRDVKDKQKAAAVLKIKSAIQSAASSSPQLLDPEEKPSRVRRLSDVGPGDAAAAAESPQSRRRSVDGVTRSSSFKRNKPKPMIWDHFDTVANSNQQGRCKACHMVISCKYNTGQFVRHLQLAHMDIFRKYQAKIQTEWTKSIVEKNISKT